MVHIGDLGETELYQLHNFYVTLSDLAEEKNDITCTDAIDAAERNSTGKAKYLTNKIDRSILMFGKIIDVTDYFIYIATFNK